MKPSTPLAVAPIIFLATLVGLLALCVSLGGKPGTSSTAAPARELRYPSFERLGDDALACYRIGAAGRAQRAFELKLRESEFEDNILFAGFYRDYLKWKQADEYYQRALALAKKASNANQQAIALNDLALSLALQARTVEANEREALLLEARLAFDRAESLARQAKNARLNDTICTNRQLAMRN